MENIQSELKELLDNKYNEYCRADFFINTDPIQIPKMFDAKEDIEISGFLAASLAWGQRPVIISKCKQLMGLMDNSPYQFVMNASGDDYDRFAEFKHRTFNGCDCIYFIKAIANIYRNHGGMEKVFTNAWKAHHNMIDVLRVFYSTFTELPHEHHVLSHIANVDKGSAAKRINMYLRWMVRNDKRGIDFGLWQDIPTSALLIPLDLHSGNVSRRLGLLTRKQNDIKSVMELTENLRKFDINDPIKYDFSLFGIGAFAKMKQENN